MLKGKKLDEKHLLYKVRGKGYLIIGVEDPHSYMDIVDMPDPTNVSFCLHIYNYTVQTLWFKATMEPATGWSVGSPVQFGSIGSGSNARFVMHNHASRTLPTSPVDDGIQITVRAYTDSGYTNEVGDGYPIVVTYHWIKSDTMTLLDEDNFDDGTFQGWSATENYEAFQIVTDYVLSPPNAARMRDHTTYMSRVTRWGRVEKSFTVPDCSLALLIFNAKFGTQAILSGGAKVLQAYLYDVTTGAILIYANRQFCGKDYQGSPWTDYSNWYRFVAPITVNATHTYAMRMQSWLDAYWSSNDNPYTYLYMDDIKVVYEI